MNKKSKAIKRWIDLSNLPKDNRGMVSWKDSIGCQLPFTYGELEGVILIKDYKPEKSRAMIEVENYGEFEIFSGHLRDCKLGVLMDVYSRKHRFEIGYKFGETLEVMEQVRVLDHQNAYIKAYNCYCSKCNIFVEKLEGEVKKGERCPYCTGNRTLEGTNDIATTNPELVKFFVNPEDAKKYKKYSDKKVELKCIRCGCRKEARVGLLYQLGGVSCPLCGDGISYPQKLMMAILSHFDIQVKPEKSFSWSGDRRYDFYFKLNGEEVIIETNGMQHYEESPRKGARTLKEEQENDWLKYQQATSNGINRYIVIDCRYSSLEFIKNNVLKSELAELFDLSVIDWEWCERQTLKSKVIEVCELWNQGLSVKEISIKTEINYGVVRTYLQKGVKGGLIDNYTKEESLKRIGKELVVKEGEIVYCPELNKTFKSLSVIQTYFRKVLKIPFDHSKVKAVCKGERDHYNGYTFQICSEKDFNLL